jgi:hypothetical protein
MKTRGVVSRLQQVSFGVLPLFAYQVPAARWIIEHGPAAWRDGSIPALRTRILASIANRTFDPDLWTRATVDTDRIEVCYPEIERYWGEGPDPLNPDDTANTHCMYHERSTYWPYGQATAHGWPPLPGWQAAIDDDRWFIDLWQAQRSLTYPLPPLTIDDRKDFVVLHLQGTITAFAKSPGSGSGSRPCCAGPGITTRPTPTAMTWHWAANGTVSSTPTWSCHPRPKAGATPCPSTRSTWCGPTPGTTGTRPTAGSTSSWARTPQDLSISSASIPEGLPPPLGFRLFQ